MSTYQYFRFDYLLNRRVHGPIVSALIAIRTALKPTLF